MKNVLWCIYIGCILTFTSSGYCHPIKVTTAKGVLGFRTSEITLKNGRPKVIFYEGDKKIEWKPSETPAEKKTERMAAGGYAAADHKYTWNHSGGYQLTYCISKLSSENGFTVRAYFKNNSSKVVRLSNFHLGTIDGADFHCAGDPGSWLLDCPNYFTRRYGTLAQNLPSEKKLNKEGAYIGRAFIPPTENERYSDGSWRYFKDIITLYRDEGLCKEAKGIVISAIGPGAADVFLNFRVQDGKITCFELISQMDNIDVDPGETRESEEVLIISDNYHHALKMAYECIRVTHGSRTNKDAVFGWCSWYGPYNKITEQKVIAVADAVKDQRDLIPIQVIQIDDKWQVRGDDWIPNKDAFPKGMQPVAEHIKAAGARPGLWMSIMQDNKGRIHPESWYIDRTHLDIGNPDCEAWVRQTLRKYYNEGYRYWKFDFNYYGRKKSVNRKWTRFQHFRKWYEVIRDELKEDSYILACVGNFERSLAGLVDSMRIGSDTPIRWNVSLKSDGLPKHPRCFWFNFQTAASSALANGVVLANDPDVTYARYNAGKGNTEMVRGWHSWVGILGGAQIVSDTIDERDRFKKGSADMRMMEIINPAAPDKGWSMRGAVDPRHPQLGFVAERTYGNFAAIAIVNHDISDTMDLNVDTWWTEKKMDAEKVHVWSFWDEKYMGIAKNGENGIAAGRVAPHGGCKLLRLSQPKKNQPVIVGSTLHISMGSAELKKVSTSSGGINIELNPNAGSYDGRLYVYSKVPLALQSSKGLNAFVVKIEKNIYAVVVDTRQRNKLQRINLITTKAKVLTLEDVKADSGLLNKYNLAGFKKL